MDGLFYFYRMESIERKKDGFKGELFLIVPPYIIDDVKNNPISSNCFVTDIGYYPKAKLHYRERSKGCKHHILIHCVDGKGQVLVGDNYYHLQANQYIVIPANVSHAYEADKEDPWSIFWMHFGGHSTMPIVSKITSVVRSKRNFFVFGKEHKVLFEKIYHFLSKGYGREIMDSVALITPSFLQPYAYPEMTMQVGEIGVHDIVQDAISFLKSRVRNKVTLEEIAGTTNLSVSHFSKIFKNRTGYSPVEYLNHLKLQEACFMLKYSSLRISEISFELGFEDQFYFSRLFKTHMGLSPLNYRKDIVNKCL